MWCPHCGYGSAVCSFPKVTNGYRCPQCGKVEDHPLSKPKYTPAPVKVKPSDDTELAS